MTIRYFVQYWLPVIFWMGIIFWMSTGMFSTDQTSRIIVPILNDIFPWLTQYQVGLIHELLRKTAHAAEYFILGILFFYAFRGHTIQKWRLQWTLYAVIGVLLYAASDELHQIFVSSRTASLADVGIDSAGAIFSLIAIILWQKVMRGS
ncbi:MAG: hypothetical protein CSYNP_04065 [Syntrophus sp. SKADARSKE-3]|nr:hypothetical protein [Syntrophus sp. SKADARSKE-3]